MSGPAIPPPDEPSPEPGAPASPDTVGPAPTEPLGSPASSSAPPTPGPETAPIGAASSQAPVTPTPAAPLATPPPSRARSGQADGAWVGGFLLIAIGLFFLLGQRVPDLGQYIVLGVGLFLFALFLVYGDYGLLVPACIVSGVGAGIPLAAAYEGELGGGIFLVTLGCGFLAIWVLGLLFRLRENHPWPLVPGVILGTLGATTAARVQGQDAVNVVETVWPIAVILVGGLLILTTLAGRRRT